jgi:hypothetical protein
MIVINSTKYQQNEQSPLILTELTEHKKTTCDLGIILETLPTDKA